MSAEKILVVEQNPATRKILRVILDLDGYDVVAADGATALEADHRRPAELVIVGDVRPDQDAVKLLATLRTAHGTHLPAIRITGPVEPSRLLDLVHAQLPPRRDRAPGSRLLAVHDETPNRKLAVLFGELVLAAESPGLSDDGWIGFARRLARELDQPGFRLRESEEQYRLLFDSNPFPIFVVDQERLAFLAVNDASVRKYGFSRAEFLGMTPRDLRTPQAAPAVADDYARAPEEGDTGARFVLHTTTHRTKDGTPIEAQVARTLIVFQGRPAWLCLVSDVTEKKGLEAQLARAQKMEAIGQLAGGVAHDFNNLLGVISGYSELLSRELSAGSRERKRSEEIKKAADRAAALTRQLLAFSRRQVLQPRVLDLNDVVGDVEKMMRRLISESIQIVTIAADKLGKVRADAGQVEQVLMNLAINARDAMPSGGRLIIETGNVDLDQVHVRENPEAVAGSYVMLAVSDNGHGMDESTLGHIFEPFFTTKEEGKGTGLGLATVYGIVRQSGGTITVNSTPGQGTRFKVYLPRVAEDLEVDAGGHASPAPGGMETILLVEDAEALRLLIRELLESAGYTVLDAEAPDKALDLIEATPGPIHLVLTDMVMPRMSGQDLAKRISIVKPEARIVFMSGYSDQAVADHGTLTPGSLFLQKPFTMEALMATIRRALDS